jgi:hypothetical protein
MVALFSLQQFPVRLFKESRRTSQKASAALRIIGTVDAGDGAHFAASK